MIESSDDASNKSFSANGTGALESPIVFSDCPASPELEEKEVYECDESECELVYSDISSD